MANALENSQKARKLLMQARNELAAMLDKQRSRTRGVIVRELHIVSNMLAEGGRYFSQSGQDRIIDRVLAEKTGGIFVDVGGYDGVTGSNTLFFEMFRGWSGLLIEPAPGQLQRARSVRRCPCLGCAVSGTHGRMDFMEVTSGYSQMSGFPDQYDPELLEQVRAHKAHSETLHRVDAKQLAEVLSENGLSKIDYLSLDVEGAETGILESFPFGDFEIDIWSIENNAQNGELPKLMREKGYDLIEFAGVDDLFRRRP